MKELGVVVVGIAAVLAAFVFAAIYITCWIDAGYQDRQCRRFALVTGRETQFRQFSHWSYDCYVRAQDGKWILKGQLRDIVGD